MGSNIAEYAKGDTGHRHLIAVASVVHDISSGFVDPVEFDAQIHHALEGLGRLYGAARAGLFRPRLGVEGLVQTHQWCAVSAEGRSQDLPGPQNQASPWLVDQLRAGKALFLPDMSSLSKRAAADRSHFETQGIRSLLAVPIQVAGGQRALIQLDNVRQMGSWTREEQILVEVAGNAIGGALSRRPQNIGRLEDDQVCHEYFRLRSVGIAETTPRGQLLRVSDELCSLLGYPRSKLLSPPLQALVHPQDLAAHPAEYDRMLRGEVQSYSTRTCLYQQPSA